VGRVLSGRYRLIAPVGAGASAVVYLAEDTILRRRVAVKLLREVLATDERFLRRFRAEAHAAAALNHPHILTVFDSGEDEGEYYLITEYLGGGSLQGIIDAGHRLSLSQALLVGLEAGRGLEYAARRSLVHRDIKPANLLFDDGELNGVARLRIGDFGLARALAEAAWTEPSGSVVGTARYACPEQVRGEPIDGRGDVYSLALVLVEVVTGDVPFAADTALTALMARMDKPMRVPDEMGPLADILSQAGLPDPADRPTATQFVNGLLAAAPQLDPPARLPLVSASAPVNVAGGGRHPTSVAFAPAAAESTSGAAGRTGAQTGPWSVGSMDRVDGAGGGVAALPFDPPGSANGIGGNGAPSSGGHTKVLAPGPAGPGAAPGPDPSSDGTSWSDRMAVVARRRRVPLLVAILVLAALAGTVAFTQLRTPTHVVPALRGQPEAEARSMLEQLNWEVIRADGREDGSVPGTVLGQTPDGGRLAEGESVTIVVSLGNTEVPVPQVVVAEHMALDAAKQALAFSGLQAADPPTVVFDEAVPADHVVAFAPGTPEMVPKGDPVGLVVSKGPEPRVVPPVPASLTVQDATAALAALRLEGVPKDTFDEKVPAGSVVGFEPASGQPVARDSKVSILVSQGTEEAEVPDVKGLSAVEATKVLEAAGFKVSQVLGSPDDEVFFTQPGAGEKEKRGSLIIIISRPDF
jgi:serine/threonine-protein kinase